MVGDVVVMVPLFQIIIVFLLLLLLSFAVPKLHPLLYATIFFLMLFIFMTTIVFPFATKFMALFEAFPNPFLSLLIGSAILFYLSTFITDHIAEAGYRSLAELGQFAVKIAILLLWMDEIKAMLEILSTFIKK